MQADDYNAIRNLVHEYAHRLDHGDVTAVGDLFADAAVWFGEDSSPVRNDPAAISSAFADWLQLYDGVPRTRHAMSNLQIWPDGEDRARATCYVMVFQQTPGLPLQPIIGGDYLDRFERHDGAWRFSERVIRNDLFGDLTAHGRYRLGKPAPRSAGAEQADIESIRQLKASYFRLLDSKDWDGLTTLFATEATIDLRAMRRDPRAGMPVGDDTEIALVQGRREIVSCLQRLVGDAFTVHHGLNPEVTLLSPTHASGIWALEDRLGEVQAESSPALHGFGYHHDTYGRQSEAWTITSTRLVRTRLELQ